MNSEVLLEALLSALGCGVFILDEECRILYANRSAERLLGREGADLHGTQVDTLIGALGQHDCRAFLAEQRVRLRHGDGEGSLISLRCFPLPGGGQIMLLSDASAHAAREDENLRLFRAAQAQADDMFALYQISQLLGSETEDLETEVLNELMRLVRADAGALLVLSSRFGERQAPMWELVASEGVGKGASWQTLQSGAREISVFLSGGPNLAGSIVGDVHDPGAVYLPLSVHGRSVGMVWLRTVSPGGFAKHDLRMLNQLAHEVALAILSRRTHRELESERAKLVAVVNGASDGVMLVDEQHLVSVFNPALERLTGRSTAQVLGQLCSVALGCSDKSDRRHCESECPFELVRRTGAPIPYREMVLTTVEGRRLAVAGSYALMHSPADGRILVVAIVRDVSRQKETEQLKSTFIATVSHELRTPLALIRGYAETLLHFDLDEATRRHLVVELGEATERLSSIVGDVLDVSSFDAGQLQLHLSTVDVCALVRTVTAEYAAQAPQHQLLSFLPQAPLLAVWDAGRMRQVLANLIVNAIKYSPAGGRVLVRVWTDQQTVFLSVTDEGLGLARHEMVRLFGRFQRLESAAISRAPGSGLGLYICQRIVATHGGSIRAESPPPHGGTVALPFDWRGGTLFTVGVPRTARAPQGEGEAPSWTAQPV